MRSDRAGDGAGSCASGGNRLLLLPHLRCKKHFHCSNSLRNLIIVFCFKPINLVYCSTYGVVSATAF